MRLLIVLLCCSFSLNFVTAQSFDWCNDGYVSMSGGGFFPDIDGSGIDLTISGMVSDNCASNYVYPGINDQNSTGDIHYYSFSFSELVSLEFRISDINTNSLNNECYHDFLYISDSPNLTDFHSVSINSGDTIIPLSETSGSVIVHFDAISDFTITHGDGVACNPGYLIFNSLIINNNYLGIPLSAKVLDKTLVKITDLMGRETEAKKNEIQIYIYSDGTSEKVFRFE